AAKFDADDVFVRIDPERGGAERVLHSQACGSILARGYDGGWISPRDLTRKAGTGQRNKPRLKGQNVPNHLAHSHERFLFNSLCSADEYRFGSNCGSEASDDFSDGVRGHYH